MLSSLGWGAFTTPAEACSPDPCWSTEEWIEFELLHEKVATDGVLVFAARRGSSVVRDPVDMLQYVSIEVLDAQGQAVTGNFTYDAGFGLALWRPDAPLAPDTEHTVSLLVDNATLRDDYPTTLPEGCAENVQADRTVTTTTGALGPLSLPEATSTTEVQASTILSDLQALVCCDGAMPVQEFSCVGDEVWWSEGFCTGTTEHRRLAIDYTFDWSDLAEERVASTAIRLRSDDNQVRSGGPGTASLSMSPAAPICVTIEVVDLPTGDLVESEQTCFGADEGPLGTVEIDPSETLEASCSGEAYVCALDPARSAWDPEQCIPWGDGDGSTGGAEGGDAGTDGGGTDGGDTDGGSEDSSGGQDDIADRGCTCSTTRGRTPSGPMLAGLVLGLVGWRRNPAQPR